MYKEDMNFKEFIELLGWSKNKFFLNIKKICSEEVYDININKFKKAGEEKEDYSQDERNFCFKSEWIDIAYVLFTMFVESQRAVHLWLWGQSPENSETILTT